LCEARCRTPIAISTAAFSLHPICLKLNDGKTIQGIAKRLENLAKEGDSPVDFFLWFDSISKTRIPCLNYDRSYVTKGDHPLSLSIPQ
jgi:hypothetical protein